MCGPILDFQPTNPCIQSCDTPMYTNKTCTHAPGPLWCILNFSSVFPHKLPNIIDRSGFSTKKWCRNPKAQKFGIVVKSFYIIETRVVVAIFFILFALYIVQFIFLLFTSILKLSTTDFLSRLLTDLFQFSYNLGVYEILVLFLFTHFIETRGLNSFHLKDILFLRNT